MPKPIQEMVLKMTELKRTTMETKVLHAKKGHSMNVQRYTSE